MPLSVRLFILSVFLCGSCSPTPNDIPDDGPDAGGVSSVDSGASSDEDNDAGGPTTPVPLPGFGTVSGACGVLASEVPSPSPSFFVNTLDFGTDPYDDVDEARLTDGGREILADGNAGGSSLLSEVFAYEVLARCEGATLLKTELEVEYTDPQGKITDLLVELAGERVGVSVTRAVTFPRDQPYALSDAQELLEKKLSGILSSSANVAADDAWQKQILSVIAYAPAHAAVLEEALQGIDTSLQRDTIVYVTVSEGDDEFLY
ncbi:MAG: hypothetical protein ACO3JL_19495 [Myxococcota bacterium]